jgi:hypothetical protein
MGHTPTSPRWFPVSPDVDVERLDPRLVVEVCCLCGGDGLASDHYVVRAEE